MTKLNREPALLIGFLVAGVVALAGHFNILLDETSVEAVLAPIIAAILTRQRVSPVVRDV